MLDKKELAASLKISVMTVNRLLVKGLPHIKVGGQVRFVYDEVIEWFKNKQGI